MHLSVKELQEVNKEVLLGKKRLNCLSCGKTENKDTIAPGLDGKIYRVDERGKVCQIPGTGQASAGTQH